MGIACVALQLCELMQAYKDDTAEENQHNELIQIAGVPE
jgi:hypothetical protein